MKPSIATATSGVMLCKSDTSGHMRNYTLIIMIKQEFFLPLKLIEQHRLYIFMVSDSVSDGKCSSLFLNMYLWKQLAIKKVTKNNCVFVLNNMRRSLMFFFLVVWNALHKWFYKCHVWVLDLQFVYLQDWKTGNLDMWEVCLPSLPQGWSIAPSCSNVFDNW